MICHAFAEPLYLLYVPELSGLLYYSHIPAIIISLLVGSFVLWSDRARLLNQMLFSLCLAFSVWTLLNLISWTNIHSEVILFSWSLFGSMSALISIFSIYFIYVFLTGKDISIRLKFILLTLLAPVIILAPTTYSLSGFNISYCDAFGFEGKAYESYYHALGALAIIWILALLVRAYRKADAGVRKQIVLMGSGIELFLISFFTTGFLSSYLAANDILPDSELEIYGLFGMIIFMVYIGIFLVRFKAFHTSLIAAQALVVALLVLIAAQFTFARSTTNLTLNATALVLTAAMGYVLIRSVKREIGQRRRIEHLARELEKANQQQVALIHFITHQLKGFMSKSRNIFSMVLEGEFGQPPEAMRPMLEEGLRSGTKGTQTIEEILNAANIKSGKVTYAKVPIGLAEIVGSVVADLKPNAAAKGVELTFATHGEGFTIAGDRMQLTNAFKNLIDNAVKYTPHGSVQVSLTRNGNAIRIMTEDTGVGITPEDMAHLFTEGGHGKESRKVNVESTGFGLYIVKNIVDAHGGKVWAESEGAGKGARFIIELPAS